MTKKPNSQQPDTRHTFVERTFDDRAGKLALAQLPNVPIIVWVVARGMSWLLHGTTGEFFRVVAFGALFVWAWLELFHGVNYFRRGLGLIVLIGLIMSGPQSGHF